MAASGNTTPMYQGVGAHGESLTWVVTATGVTTFTIQTPFANKHVIIDATSQGTALVDTGSYALTTGVATITCTAGDVVVVNIEVMEN